MTFKDNGIDKSIPIPLYFQLKELILAEIKSGNYESDSMIPTENELSEMFKLSRTTVRQAILELVNEGWLYRVKSKGTFISQPKYNHDFVTKIESFNTQLTRYNILPSTEVLDFKLTKVNENIANELKINEVEPVIYLHRRRFANDEPIVVLKTYLPNDLCGFILEKDFRELSLYTELGKYEETTVVRVERQIEAVEASAYDEKYLQIKPRAAVLFFTSVGYNKFGRPIEYSLARYRGDKSSFNVTAELDE